MKREAYFGTVFYLAIVAGHSSDDINEKELDILTGDW